MRKWLSVLLLITLLCSIAILPAHAEEEVGGTGEWIFDLPAHEEVDENFIGEAAPYIPENMEKTIFGNDDRITVSSPSTFPYSAIAYMKMKYKCNCRSTGTGFVAGTKNTVFTAAHCVVCSEHGEWAEEITFYFGYKNDRNYLYKYNGKWYAYAGNTFANKSYTIDGDYAVIRLYSDVGDKTGSFGVRWNPSDSMLTSAYAYVAGYRDGVLRYDQGFLSSGGQNHIHYTLDTLPGNSGGPVFTGDYYAIGINIAQNNAYNIAYRINNDVFYAYDYVK